MSALPGTSQTTEAHEPHVDAELFDDPRLVRVVQEYLQQVEAGQRPNRNAFLLRHPDLVIPLSRCLDGLELVDRAGSPQGETLTPEESALETPGSAADPLGDFKLLREIGRGGMGVVYEAVQLSLGRRVALKVLPFAATLDARQLRRFHNEAQAAASLHHTNIVPVYAVGCERGVHFYAMQLIEGHSLAVVIQQVRQRLGRPDADDAPNTPTTSGVKASSDNLGTVSTPQDRQAEADSQLSQLLSTRRGSRPGEFFRAAARMIVQAAEALEHAHQFGIVHRDIKPANLLVDAEGRLWITDFGVAQFHADAGLTQTGDLLGTLRYMSPEQASGQRGLLDHRTDVYSLGATLYELTTLEPIFDGTSRHGLLNQIIHHEPRPPRAVEPLLPVELETIILKAVAKNPQERYGSAKDLAADLQRYLDDKPIHARRPTLLERGRKWLRRHPSVLVSAILLLAVIALGSTYSAWLIRDEQRKTQIAYEAERTRALEAQDRFLLARRAVDEMIHLAEEELLDQPHMRGFRKRLLENALVYYQEFIEQRRDEPEAQAELAATRDRIQKILTDLTVLQGAGHLVLLREPDVLEDLDADEEQRKRIGKLMERQAQQRQLSFQQYRRLSGEERRAKFLNEARANEAAITDILGKDKVQRLRQIALQVQGAMALREPDVAAALKLTPEQRERIRAIEGPGFAGKADRVAAEMDASSAIRPEAFPKKMRVMRVPSGPEKVLPVLDAEQRERWEGMVGPPFQGRVGLRVPGPYSPPLGPPPERARKP